MSVEHGAPMTSESSLPSAEERLNIAIDAGDVGTWEWTIPTGEVAWSGTLERIHGFAPGAFGGKFDVYASYIHEDDRESVLGAIQRAVAERAPYLVEYRMYKPDGSTHWVSARGRVFCDATGAPQKMMGICMDVTERRRATDGLRLLSDASSALASSLDYDATLPMMARLCVPLLADWCVIDLLDDGGALRRLAVAHREPQKEALARDLQARYPTPPSAPNGPPHVVRTGTIEMVPDIPVALLEANARDEEHLRILIGLGMRSYLCLPIHARGRILGALTLVNAESRRSHDRQDLQLAEELAARAGLAIDNARLYQKSVEASRAKDEFLATLSHELKSPITAVLGYATLLELGGLDEKEQRAAIESIKLSARAQARLVEDLLEVSREVMGKVRVEVAPMDVGGAVQQAVDAIAPTAAAKGVRLRAGAADGCVVLADPGRIQQVLWNLMTNALKFTPTGGEVVVSATRENGTAVIEVRDTGAGIAPDFLPFVFERFRQGANAREHGGLGLGLAIVKHLVELHGGTIEARSSGEGTGAAFTVRLPLYAETSHPAPPAVAQRADGW